MSKSTKFNPGQLNDMLLFETLDANKFAAHSMPSSPERQIDTKFNKNL